MLTSSRTVSTRRVPAAALFDFVGGQASLVIFVELLTPDPRAGVDFWPPPRQNDSGTAPGA